MFFLFPRVKVFTELFSKSDNAGGRLAPLHSGIIIVKTKKASLAENLFVSEVFFAEGEKTICYIVFDGFRQPTPDSSEPNGDGRIMVSMSLPLFSKKRAGFGAAPHKKAGGYLLKSKTALPSSRRSFASKELPVRGEMKPVRRSVVPSVRSLRA